MIGRRSIAAIAALLFQGVVSVAGADQSATLSVDHGRYLALVGNCLSCHVRKGGEPFAGGREFVTPFGIIYSTNITPDPDTGIGKWSKRQFADALRKGVRADGQHLYPVFPYASFTKIRDADVAALFEYFRSLRPVKYSPPANRLKFPASQRWALGAWKYLYFNEARYQPAAGESAEWNRGAYLVQGLGHCGSCHTPRNFLGAEDRSRAFHGATYQHRVEDLLLDWSASNLTGSANGLAQWTVDDVAGYLKFGFSQRAGVFGGMNDVVLNSTRHLSMADVRAMAIYLKSLPASPLPKVTKPGAAVMAAGSLLYDVHCGTCHLPSGLGSADTGPPLAGSAVVLADDPASLINVTLYGAQLPESAPSSEWLARRWHAMEAFGEKIDDEEIAALLTYVRGSWGNHAEVVDARQVANQRMSR